MVLREKKGAGSKEAVEKGIEKPTPNDLAASWDTRVNHKPTKEARKVNVRIPAEVEEVIGIRLLLL
jgi:hypothetical protein